jgi:transposase
MTRSASDTSGHGHRKPRHSYDEAFKRDAVALLEGGRMASQLARELGISVWNLRDWKRRYSIGAGVAGLPARSAGQPGAAGPSAVAAAVELADLRRELEATRRQRDILKKALAIVAQEDANATPSSKSSSNSSLT